MSTDFASAYCPARFQELFVPEAGHFLQNLMKVTALFG
jgi:hypothetical protein